MPERLPDLTEDVERVVRLALDEDGSRDLSSEVSIALDHRTKARVELRGRGVFAGTLYAGAVARRCECQAEWLHQSGDLVSDTSVGLVQGSFSSVLRAERPLLNLLQRASGIATATRACVDSVAGTGCIVLHTRKTAPGLRLFDAAAVLAGGGQLHRLDLAHTVLIKDNHWRALREAGRPLATALDLARRNGALECQVEVESLDQLREACAAGADRLLLDNQSPEVVREWSRRARALCPGIAIEATGRITLATIRAFADAGADFVSIGALTHSVVATDLGLTLERTGEESPR